MTVDTAQGWDLQQLWRQGILQQHLVFFACRQRELRYEEVAIVLLFSKAQLRHRVGAKSGVGLEERFKVCHCAGRSRGKRPIWRKRERMLVALPRPTGRWHHLNLP